MPLTDEALLCYYFANEFAFMPRCFSMLIGGAPLWA